MFATSARKKKNLLEKLVGLLYIGISKYPIRKHYWYEAFKANIALQLSAQILAHL